MGLSFFQSFLYRLFITVPTPSVLTGTSHWMKDMEDGPLRAVLWWRKPGKRLFADVTTWESLLSPWI